MILARNRVLGLVLGLPSLFRREHFLVATGVRGTHGVHPTLTHRPGAGHHGARFALADVALTLFLHLLQGPGKIISAGGGEGRGG